MASGDWPWCGNGGGRGSALSSSRRLRNASKGLGAPKVAALVLREHDHTLAFWRALGYESDERVDRRVRSFR